LGPNRRRMDRERTAAVEALTRKQKRRLFREARVVVGLWNAARVQGCAPLAHPTLRAAIAAGTPWLSFCCPACRHVGEIDLRKIDRHPDATIESLIPSLSCRQCRPNPPFAVLTAVQSFALVASLSP
jgi:hypothetical protein